MADKQNQLNTFWEELKSTLKLNVDYAKLTAAEKMTMLLTSVAFALQRYWRRDYLGLFHHVRFLCAYPRSNPGFQEAVDYQSDCAFCLTSLL